jgi:hypothetical protein
MEQVLVKIALGTVTVPNIERTLREMGLTMENGDPGDDDLTPRELIEKYCTK